MSVRQPSRLIFAFGLRLCLTFLLLGFSLSSLPSAPAQESTEPTSTSSPSPSLPTPEPPYGRIVLVGASVSAGFTGSEPLGGPKTPLYHLNRYLDAALLLHHEPVQNLAHAMFFMKPETQGLSQIDRALKTNPTLVIGIDFLFWFCYGEGSTDHARLDRFEQGLKALEPVRCPLIIGDIPDASAAANGMLRPEQIPATTVMATANQRLREWARARPQVVIVPLSQFMGTIMRNKELTVHHYTLPEGRTRRLLQRDKLHPSPTGCAFLTLAILDAFQSTQPATDPTSILWDPKELFRLATTPTQASP